MSNSNAFDTPPPSRELYNQVRAGFVLKDSSINKFCLSIGINHGNARKALLGQWNGVKGQAIRHLLWEASQDE